MSDDISNEVSERRGHLGRLALIFYHRRASWRDFGDFIDGFFDGSLGIHVKMPEMGCRHGPGGMHHDVMY